MKINRKFLPLMAAGLGLLTTAARLGLYTFGTDAKGLLITGHPLNILVWVLTVLSAVLICLAVKKDTPHADDFGSGLPAALGTAAMAAAIALTLAADWDAWLPVDRIRNYLGLPAVAGLLAAAFCQLKGKQPYFLLPGAAWLYLTVYTVSHYQTWCAQPLMQNYFFPMAGGIFLILSAYCRTAFSVGLGKARFRLLTGLLGGFLCLAAAAGSYDRFLYLGGALWLLTDLCGLSPRKDDSHAAA